MTCFLPLNVQWLDKHFRSGSSLKACFYSWVIFFLANRSIRHGIIIYEALEFTLFSVHTRSGRNKLPFDNCLILGTVDHLISLLWFYLKLQVTVEALTFVPILNVKLCDLCIISCVMNQFKPWITRSFWFASYLQVWGCCDGWSKWWWKFRLHCTAQLFLSTFCSNFHQFDEFCNT